MHSSIYSASNNNTVSPQQLRNSASNNEKSLIFNQFAPTLHNEDLDALSNYPFLFDFTQELAEDSCTWSTSSGSSSSNSSPKPVNLEKCPSMASTYSSESDYEALSSLFANTPDIAFEPWRLLTDSQAKEISSSPDSGLEANFFNSQLLGACFSPMQTDHSFDPCGNPFQLNHHHHHHQHDQSQSQPQSQSPFYSNSNTPAQLLPALLSEAWSTPSTPYQHYLANNGAFVCRWRQCHAVFDDLDTLVDHLVQVHVSSGKSVYACGWANCPRSTRPFSKRHKIVTHLRTHTGERPFRCDQANCDRSFTRLDALVAHMRIHTNVRPYECPEPGCKRKYFHSRSLRKHTKMHAKWNGMALSSSAATAHSLMSSQLCSELLMESLKNQHESC